MEELSKAIARAADQHDFETDMNAGALTVEFEEPRAKFVVSPNSPVHQIWVSAHSRSFKLEWSDAADTFVLPATGQTLLQLMAQHITDQIGETVTL